MEITSRRPKISVVMSFYKEPLQWMASAVESILNQSFTDFEFIIICDNPENAGGLAYIQELSGKDSRIKLIENPVNIGITKSLNKGLETARGEYIARMDSDDIALEERFQRQVDFLDSHRDISVCATNAHSINARGRIIKRNRYSRKLNPNNLFIFNSIAHPSVMFRRELLNVRKPLYNEDCPYSQDYELWQHLFLKGHKIHTLPETLMLYRKSRNQISSSRRMQQDQIFRTAHKEFICKWLESKGIIMEEDRNSLHIILEKACASYKTLDIKSRDCMSKIIYTLYYSIGTTQRIYRMKYLFDSNLIILHVRFILTLRLLFSNAKRRNRLRID